MKVLKGLFLSVIIITCIMLINSILYPNVEIVNNKIELQEKYIPNIKAYNLFTKIDKNITTKDNINNNVVGDYYINVNVKYLYFNVNKKIKVSVVDSVKPSIVLNGSDTSYVCPGKEYIEEGYTASDNYDSDITAKVLIDKLDNEIIYKVLDSSNNKYEVKRQLIFKDIESPSITLNGSENMTLYLGNKYNEPGYTATDNCDGDITDKVKVDGNVDVNKIGTYKITYSVTDSTGNETIVERTVTIKSKPVAVNYYGNGNIYLTFDDGSSSQTGRILDILDSEGVKATFFVVHANEYTKRAYNSGHTIALHSATHNYSYIYANTTNYFDDLNTLSNTLNNLIGIRPTIIRFPGGSSNTVSRNYYNGIMSYLTKEVTNRGYTYFDWNVDSNDAGGDVRNSNKIYANVVNNLSHSKTNIVLMHDSEGHRATVDALRNIIRYGKENGYTFSAITLDTPVVHHGVSN